MNDPEQLLIVSSWIYFQIGPGHWKEFICVRKREWNIQTPEQILFNGEWSVFLKVKSKTAWISVIVCPCSCCSRAGHRQGLPSVGCDVISATDPGCVCVARSLLSDSLLSPVQKALMMRRCEEKVCLPGLALCSQSVQAMTLHSDSELCLVITVLWGLRRVGGAWGVKCEVTKEYYRYPGHTVERNRWFMQSSFMIMFLRLVTFVHLWKQSH